MSYETLMNVFSFYIYIRHFSKRHAKSIYIYIYIYICIYIYVYIYMFCYIFILC